MPDKNPDAGTHDPAPEELLRHTAPPGLKRWGKIAIVVALVIAVAGIGWRLWRGHATAAWTDDQAVQTVQIIKLGGARTAGALNLPGDVQAFTNAPIYAQVSGYVKKWYFDIGAPVKKGQLLAELDTPDLAGQAAQARANLANSQAAQKLSAATAARFDALFAQGAVSRQDKDVNDADLPARTRRWRRRAPRFSACLRKRTSATWWRPLTVSSPAAPWITAPW